MGKITILIAVASRVLAEGLARVVADEKDNYCVCLASLTADPKVDILLFDAQQELKSLQVRFPTAKPLLIDTGLKDQEITLLLTSYQIRGVIRPQTTVNLLHKAIRVVNRGDLWLGHQDQELLLSAGRPSEEKSTIRSLSPQQRKIMTLAGQGFTNREIGAQIYLSEHTVKAHLSRIYKLLKVGNRTQLAALNRG